MNNINIKYNPFTVETIFTVNGTELSDQNILSELKNRRLQLWVANLPEKLSEFFNDDINIVITFEGLESDYIDLKEEVERANANGMNIDLNVKPFADSAESRLNAIKTLVSKAKENKKFVNYLENNSEVKQGLEESFNNDVDAYVVATMSSGKSTFINALLGHDLLPARNEATTATIAQIFNTKLDGYYGERYGKDNVLLDEKQSIDLRVLNEWNDLEKTHTIRIEGSIRGIQERDNVRLVLTDTPGPNNSRDESHARLTMSYIQDSIRNPLILYILNATQLGINDDKNLLSLVAKEIKKGGKQAKDRFIFVVNKCDEFDLEKESLEKALDNVRNYLQENGIDDPLIYPVSAFAARLIRNDEQKLTAKERREKNSYIDQFQDDHYNFVKYMPLTAKVSRKVEELGFFDNQEFNTALKNTGIPAVEMMIDEYIDKYNLPHRLNRAKVALEKAINSALNEEKITLSLEQDEGELKEILDSIHKLEQKREQGFQTETYKQKLKEKKNQLPTTTIDAIESLRTDIVKTLNNAGNSLRGEISQQLANKKLESIENELKFKFGEVINALENAYTLMQKDIQSDLSVEYQKYVASIFEDANSLNIPTLEGLKHKLQHLNIAVARTVSAEVKSKRVRVGQRQVSTSRWYNPFSWGRTETIGIYEDKKYVSLDELWGVRLKEVRGPFDKLLVDGIKHLQFGANQIVDLYIAFMSKEFDQQFDKIISDLTEKIQDKDKREQVIAKAKQELLWIQNLRTELNTTLVV
ncbi:hypothetical protein F975_00848 [Acinetobacter sp. ANC 3789]|uniref:dynamin family protein n=1 Tax=Acinetobacter sp. ANC 3789 TaxID=1217714 RepID=UPI0002D07272|nr:dynamin family protein [Acinetobacter sp. ANC 3789]ENU80990.1 hypothetical protein F975_00848 [Acinetobacter sp. ANC 3789]